MLYDASGRPAKASALETIEDCKSFSYRVSLKNPDGSPAYESADFFQSRKYRSRPEDQDAAAREAYEWCAYQVAEDIMEFKRSRARKEAAREQRRVA